MCFFNLAGVVFYEPMEGESVATSVAFFAVIYLLVAGVSFVVLFFFWRGHNWARWLVLATSILALYNLTELSSVGWVQAVVIVSEAVLGAWLLYWLNTGSARAFFRGQSFALPQGAG
jgi:hypothetical protein